MPNELPLVVINGRTYCFRQGALVAKLDNKKKEQAMTIDWSKMRAGFVHLASRRAEAAKPSVLENSRAAEILEMREPTIEETEAKYPPGAFQALNERIAVTISKFKEIETEEGETREADLA
jgi:hypothetical protein